MMNDNLNKSQANYVSLSPLSFLPRTASVYPNRVSVIHGERRYTWSETYARCRRLASALASRGVRQGDTVALMAPNVPEAFESHFGVPMTGAILNALNTRLDAKTIAFILEHGGAKVLITDREFSSVVMEALALMTEKPIVIDIDDPLADGGELLGEMDYETFLAGGDPQFDWSLPNDEWQSIALNYTSGTTGNPKGVLYHHRGAYLNAIGNNLTWNMASHPVYLWTLPMFHCNGWCFPWTITLMAGTHVCLRTIDSQSIFAAIQEHKVTHMCGAPIVMVMMVNAEAEIQQMKSPSHNVKMMTAGAAPPAKIIENMEQLGFEITHVYGLTEVYGPVTLCAWHEDWDELPREDRAAIKARQGVRSPVLEGLTVVKQGTMNPVDPDGEMIGELLMRGNVVMKGYLKNDQATSDAFDGGWFHTGDLGVVHSDGYVELKDRSKDIIISGGENISTIEVEDVLYQHPDILEAAVVARPNEKWGETPCAFVTLKKGALATDMEIIAFCREHLAHFKAPKTVVFDELPKTSTGKIQKFELRARAQNLE
tara:strand:- start:469 stop:2091 length:1623 start_codon:yes stop_codon:yes gene_type:complete